MLFKPSSKSHSRSSLEAGKLKVKCSVKPRYTLCSLARFVYVIFQQYTCYASWWLIGKIVSVLFTKAFNVSLKLFCWISWHSSANFSSAVMLKCQWCHHIARKVLGYKVFICVLISFSQPCGSSFLSGEYDRNRLNWRNTKAQAQGHVWLKTLRNKRRSNRE